MLDGASFLDNLPMHEPPQAVFRENPREIAWPSQRHSAEMGGAEGYPTRKFPTSVDQHDRLSLRETIRANTFPAINLCHRGLLVDGMAHTRVRAIFRHSLLGRRDRFSDASRYGISRNVAAESLSFFRRGWWR